MLNSTFMNFFGDLRSAIDGWLTDREADIICNRWEEGRGKRQQNICSLQIGSMSPLIGYQLLCPCSGRTLVARHWEKSPPGLLWWSLVNLNQMLIDLAWNVMSITIWKKTINRALVFFQTVTDVTFQTRSINIWSLQWQFRRFTTFEHKWRCMQVVKQNETSRFSCIALYLCQAPDSWALGLVVRGPAVCPQKQIITKCQHCAHFASLLEHC